MLQSTDNSSVLELSTQTLFHVIGTCYTDPQGELSSALFLAEEPWKYQSYLFFSFKLFVISLSALPEQKRTLLNQLTLNCLGHKHCVVQILRWLEKKY